MISFAYPWLFILLPLPVLLLLVLPAYRERRTGVKTPFLPRLVRLTGNALQGKDVVARIGRIQKLQIYLCWVLGVTAVARPQWIGEPMVKELPTRDLMLAVDLSGSMDAKDFTNEQGEQVDRLTAVKGVLDDFLSRRKGDRVGLIVFGSAPFLQVPFTDDLEVCRKLLNEAQIGMAGPKTAMGDSIGLSIQLFEESVVSNRVLIVLTDGNDTASQVPPEEAARIASDRDIVIHTVAVGDPTAVGEEALDEAVLQSVANITGGTYSHAVDRTALEQVYDALDKLETRQSDVLTHRPRSELYFWPLGLMLVVNMLYHFLQGTRYLVSARKTVTHD